MSGAQRGLQRGFFHQFAAGTVHQPHAGLHLGDGLGIDQAGRLVRQRKVQRDVIGLGVEVVNRHERDAEFLGACGRKIRIATDDSHAEGLRPPRRFGSDSAETNDAENLARQFGALQILLVPLAGASGLVGAGDVTCHGNHQPEREFRDRNRTGTRSVHHHDAAPGCNLHVDVVYANSGATNDADASGGIDERCVGLNSRAHDQRVRV